MVTAGTTWVGGAPSAADATTRMNDFAQLEANLRGFANDRARERGQPPPFQLDPAVEEGRGLDALPPPDPGEGPGASASACCPVHMAP